MVNTKIRGNRPAGFLSGFYHIWAWRPYWSCDMDFAIKLEMPLHSYTRMLHIKFQLDWPSGFREKDCGRRRRRTTDHGHPISSPCEPSAQVS